MKTDDLLVIAALGALGMVLYTRMQPVRATAAPVVTTPVYAGVPPGQQVGSPYNPATVAGWMGLVSATKGLIDSFGSFGGHDYVGGLDSVPVGDSYEAPAQHDSIYIGPDWLR